MTIAEPGIVLLEDPETRYAVHSDPEAFRSWQLLFWPSTIPAKQGYSGLLIEEMIFQVSEEHQNRGVVACRKETISLYSSSGVQNQEICAFIPDGTGYVSPSGTFLCRDP